MQFIVPISFICFFLSGAVALVYELTWLRLLRQIFGTDSLALSTMLTVFIGGIAVGTWLSGVIINKYFRQHDYQSEEKNHIVRMAHSYILIYAYAFIELLLGVYALMVPFLLGSNFLGKIWLPFAQIAVDNLMVGSLIKFVLSAIMLIIPTLLIGLSFPLLTELLNIDKAEHKDSQFLASNLYAVNTFGAIIGAAICGFYLLPVFGLDFSTRIAVLSNLTIAILCYFCIFYNRASFSNASIIGVWDFICKLAKDNKDPHEKHEQSKEYKRVNYLLLLIAFTIGFINLGLEVIWTKVLTLIIGSSTYSLTIILIAVLGGISLGAFMLNYLINFIHKFNLSYKSFLNYSLLSFACLIAISSSFFNKAPWYFLNLNQTIENILGYSPWLLSNIIKFMSIAAIIVPVTAFEGLIFAFVLYLVSGKTNIIENRKLEPVGTRVSKASYINTFGAIAGSFLTGFVLIPLFSKFGSGTYGCLITLICIAFALALFTNLYDSKFNPLAIATILACILSISFLPKLDANEISSGIAIYKGMKYKSITKKDYKRAISERILMHEEGINSVVTVVENKAANAIFLKTNGKIEAGMPINPEDPSKADMTTQVLLGQLPIFVKPNIQNALLIGMGSGISHKSLLKIGAKAELKQVDVCEIEELVYKAAGQYFNAVMTKDYGPIKLNHHITDARNFLIANRTKQGAGTLYDLIISQPSDPWISANLFTEEFWQLASSNLNQDGIFEQWIQLYSIDPEHLEIALRTFSQVFPNSMAFKPGDAAELLLIGSKQDLELDSKKMNELMKHKEVKQELSYIGINDDADLLSNLVLSPAAINKLLNKQAGNQAHQNIKILKYISNIDVGTNEYKPKLANQHNGEKNDKTSNKQKLNTDDNMLLEFHTPKQLSQFYQTIKTNLSYIEKHSIPEDIIGYLALQKDSSLLTRIAMAHSQSSSKPHPKLALGIAEQMHNINKTPASYLALYHIHKNNMNDEEADSLIYQAESRFADMVMSGKKSQVVIFEGLMGETKLNSYQLASLAQIYMYDQSWDKAQALIDRAIEIDQANHQLKIVKAQIIFQKVKQFQYPDNRLKTRDMALSLDLYEEALKVDEFSIDAYRGLASFHLFKATQSKGAEAERLKRIAIKKCTNALELNPNSWSLQLELTKIYLSSLPDSQLQLMKNPGDKLESAIKFLRNSLVLKPDSIEANYEMSQLQYLIGNIDLAYKHSMRLEELCAEGSSCVDILGTKRLEKAKALNEKLTKIASGNLQ
ncbi:MAG: hypothetical protein O3C63_04795 [Cyanobacteria bacterium]|nr:hypothetical protein [Cyanobacteriota bacterium]MDA1020970.1 hypothetical protein [Cyanobacteriota bacterium]